MFSCGDGRSYFPPLPVQELEDEVSMLRRELNEARSVASAASATWDKFRKERDVHRMHHKRVAQEKNKLIADIKRLKVGLELLRLLASDHFVGIVACCVDLVSSFLLTSQSVKESFMVS